MTPFCGKPRVVIIEPTHDASDVPRGFYRVEAELRTGDAGTVWHNSALGEWAEKLGALRES